MKSTRHTTAGQDYTSAAAARLDKDTPKWPELRVTIRPERSTIVISGITRDLADPDPQHDAVDQAHQLARRNGKPIRMTSTMASGDVVRMIVDLGGRVTLLDHARPADPHTTVNDPAAPGDRVTPIKPTKKAAGKRKQSKRQGFFLRHFPPRIQPIVKWGGSAFLVVLVVLVAIALIKGPRRPADAAGSGPQQSHPVPGPAQLYTVTPPPGWSSKATWAVPIADRTTTYTDRATGVTAALTPDDRATAQTAAATAAEIGSRAANYLSVLSADGSTRFAVPLDTPPAYGPVITTVDDAKVALIVTNGEINYWPIDGNGHDEHTVDLPDDMSGDLNTAGTGVMAALGDDKVAYLHAGTWQTLENLPLTTPEFALADGILSVQPETGAWWTQRVDAAPTAVHPTPPAGAASVDQIVAVTPTRTILAWKPPAPPTGYDDQPDIVAAYDTATGRLLAQIIATTPPQPAHTVVDDPTNGLLGADDIVLTGPTTTTKPQLIQADGFQAATAHGAVYGQYRDTPVAIDNGGHIIALTKSTLPPVGQTADHLLVLSQNQLYALPPGTTPAVATTIPLTSSTPTATSSTSTRPPTRPPTSTTSAEPASASATPDVPTRSGPSATTRTRASLTSKKKTAPKPTSPFAATTFSAQP